jgi:hypothetical protein
MAASTATPNGGILRRPRYSSSLSSSASATTNDHSDVAIVAVDMTPSKAASSDSDNNTPHDHPTPYSSTITTPPSSSLTPTTTMPINNSGGGTSRKKYPLRSLAEMVKSVTDLNNEASLDFNSVNDNTATDDDDSNLVQTKSKSVASMSSSGERNNHTTALQATEENSNDESNNNPLLLISNNGIPYIHINNNSSITTSSSTRTNVVSDDDDATVVDTTKNPIIAAAVGVMGDDGQGVVRFCELEEVRDEGKSITTIRDRLGGDRNTIIDMDNLNVETNMLKKGRTNINNDVDDDETAESDSESYGSGSNGDEDILQELGMSNFFTNSDNNNQDKEEEEEYYDNVINDQQQHVRPFRILWEILTRWATPSTVELVLTYQRMIQQCELQTLEQNDNIHDTHGSSSSSNETMATVPRNDVDIGASRQAGIMSMLKMHVPRALADLQRIQLGGIINQKLVEQRLANLVRTFDPSVPAINLNTKLWKGLTTILITITCPNNSKGVVNDDSIVVLPPSILALDMTAAEYRYLTCSVYTSLCSVD